MFFTVVINDIGFGNTGAFGIPADVAGGVVSVREFFTDEYVPDDVVKKFCDVEEVRRVVFFLPEVLDRAREGEVFFFKFFANPLTKQFDENGAKPSLKNLFREEGAVFPGEGVVMS